MQLFKSCILIFIIGFLILFCMSFKLYIFNMKTSFESDTVIYTVERRSFAKGWNGWRWVPSCSSFFPKITHKLGTLWQSIHRFLRILICCIATSYFEYILLNYYSYHHASCAFYILMQLGEYFLGIIELSFGSL